MANNAFWSTTNEINFIKGLGTGKWSNNGNVMQMTRRELIRQYYYAALRRSKWGNIRKELVLRFCEQELSA